MLHSIENRDDLEKLNELVSLQNQVKVLNLQHELEKQNFPKVWKKYLNPLLKQLKMPLSMWQKLWLKRLKRTTKQ